MQTLLEAIRERLSGSRYVNEAAISLGIVTPLLNALGWDTADPDQLVPEYSIPERGRVDYALLGRGGKPAVFIEVKGVGRALDGDRQLFEYSFHHGVPLCVLTDGREWSFYVPAGQGSYDDRRVYRLQLDDREPAECERVLTRYLARSRVRDGSAFEAAQADYRDAAGKREAAAALPRAWAALVTAPEELLVDLLSERAETLCGYRPSVVDTTAFLQRLRSPAPGGPPIARATPQSAPPLSGAAEPRPAVLQAAQAPTVPSDDRLIKYTLLGRRQTAANASVALVEILRVLVARDPARVEALAAALRRRSRNLIGRSAEEINPGRPDIARPAEIGGGWLVGLNIANRDKMTILRAAAEMYGLKTPDDLDVTLPNA